MMNESVLKKEFRERDVQRLRNIITKKYGDATGVQVGYEKQTEDRLEGDVWEEKRDCILDEYKKIYDDAMREFQLNGSMTVRYKVKNKVSGQIRWILEEGKIKFDSNLNDEVISGRLTDITASENYRNQVKESEERFQLITESMPVMIWVSGQDNKVSYTNQASRDFFGFDLKERLELIVLGIILITTAPVIVKLVAGGKKK